MDLAEGHLAALNYLGRSDDVDAATQSATASQHESIPESALKTGAYANSGLHTFNLGTGRGYSVLEMIKAFEAASGQAIPFYIAPRRSGDIASCYASTELAEQKLGWKAARALKAMCESSWHFQQKIVDASH